MAPETAITNWLRDAHAMEMQAIQILKNQAQRIETYPDLRGRILEHLEETRAQAELLERCLERLGTTVSPFKDSAAAFVGNLQALGGAFMGDEVVAAEEVGDAETARVCREILRQEEAMAGWLEEHLPEITRRYLRRASAGESAKR